MKIIFHVGPHKTATTSIQEFLQENRVSFLDQGVYVPRSLTGLPGNHEIPWSLLGWNLRLIGGIGDQDSAQNTLRATVREARSLGAHTVVFSSEDFSLLGIAEWNKLMKSIHRVDREGSELVVAFTKRPLQDLAVSAYRTLVFLGYSGTFEESESHVRCHFARTYRFLETLAESLSPLGKSVEIAFHEGNFIGAFASKVFPAIAVKDFVGLDRRANEAIPDPLTASWREVNKKYSSAFDINRPFHWGSRFTAETWSRLQEARQQ